MNIEAVICLELSYFLEAEVASIPFILSYESCYDAKAKIGMYFNTNFKNV